MNIGERQTVQRAKHPTLGAEDTSPKRGTKKTRADRDIAAAMKSPFPGPDATRAEIDAWRRSA